MKRKVILSQALQRLSPPVPGGFEQKALRMLNQFAQNKEERIVKKKISMGLTIAIVLIALTTGMALALTSLGIWDFTKDYGETPLPAAVDMVQKEFEETTFPLGEASVTLKEAISDGLVGSIVVEYRTPEGTYLYAPDSMQKTDPPTYGEKLTEEEVLKKYGAYYHSMDEHIGVMVGSEEEPLSSEYGSEQVKTADNAMTVNISFPMQGIDPDNLVYSPGLFKMKSTDWEQRERLKASIPLKLTLNADKSETVTPTLSDDAVAAGIKAVTVTKTPLTTAVKVQFEGLEADGYTYGFQAQNGQKEELVRSFLSCFAVLDDKANNSLTQGYAPVETLPGTLYIQVTRFNNDNGEEEKVGDPVAVKLR